MEVKEEVNGWLKLYGGQDYLIDTLGENIGGFLAETLLR